MTITTRFQRGFQKLSILGLVAALAACGGGGGKSSSPVAVNSVIASSVAQNNQVTSSSVGSVASDTTPDAFAFTAITGAALGANLTSAPITISGINSSTPISITGGQYAIGNGAPTSSAGIVANGQTVTVTLSAAAALSTTTQAVLTVGGVTATFSATTLDDITPDAFSFAEVTAEARNPAVLSNIVTISGISKAVPINITNGEYSIDGGAFTSAAGLVSNGQTVQVKTSSTNDISGETRALLTVGDVAGYFLVTTVHPALMGGAIQESPLNIAGVVTTLAGRLPSADGVGATARFQSPNGVVSIGADLYVVDTYNHKIRKIVIATGVVTTLAGSGSSGSADGVGTAASFYRPAGITTDGSNLYIADTENNKIRKIVIATAVVTTLAGSGIWDSADGVGTAASFRRPEGITIAGGNLYIVDTDNNKIRKIVIATGVVTTLAGSGSSGSADGVGTAASFGYPKGITTDGSNLYIADTNNHLIRKIVIATGVVTTLAGSGSGGRADGTGTAADFYYPEGITTDGSNLYIADTDNHNIRQIVIASGVVTTLAGSGSWGSADGVGAEASFEGPAGITTDGSNLYIADIYYDNIRKIVIATGEVTTLAGGGNGGVDGTGTAADFSYLDGITTDGSNLYIADTGNHKIRKIVIATGVVTTLAGTGSWGSADGVGTAASFAVPTGITTDGSNLYIADTENNKIRKIVIATGVVTTLAGSGSRGSADGVGTAARFLYPKGITTDGSNLYIADSSNNNIRKIVIATGVVTTLAGSGSYGGDDGIGAAASFNNPTGITTDGSNLYIADTGNDKIRKIVIATGVVTTLAGSRFSGSADGVGTAAGFASPKGITTDGSNLYIADNYKIRKIVIATGVVTTIAGSASRGNADGVGAAASFAYPSGITTNGFELFVTDAGNYTIRKIH